jgi:hypothetical protein
VLDFLGFSGNLMVVLVAVWFWRRALCWGFGLSNGNQGDESRGIIKCQQENA